MLLLLFTFAVPEAAYAGDARLTWQEKKEARLQKRLDRVMKRNGLPVGQENLAQDILIKQAIYVRRGGRGSPPTQPPSPPWTLTPLDPLEGGVRG